MTHNVHIRSYLCIVPVKDCVLSKDDQTIVPVTSHVTVSVTTQPSKLVDVLAFALRELRQLRQGLEAVN